MQIEFAGFVSALVQGHMRNQYCGLELLFGNNLSVHGRGTVCVNFMWTTQQSKAKQSKGTQRNATQCSAVKWRAPQGVQRRLGLAFQV